jgi:N-acyl-D-aspartate/D-glutamate deacylase
MTGDLLVRGGTVVDGTGAPARRADVRVRGGVVAEVGAGLGPDGEPELDASGACVTPGFVESHTHFDGALWWDPDCDPMPAYGTTTVIFGNCGLGMAPVRRDDRDDLIDLFSFIEDLPREVFETAVPWSWTTWDEYRRTAAGHPTAVNAAAFLPHQFLRVWVMGAEAWERPATEDERGRMARVAAESLQAGALGLSTSMMDTDRSNRWVPSRMADDIELRQLAATLAAAPDSSLQFVPRFLEPDHFYDDLHRFAAIAKAAGVPLLWAGYRLEEVYRDDRLRTEAEVARYRGGGAQCAPLYTARPTHTNLHFERSIMWHGVPAWHDLVNGAPERKRALLADPAWQAQARHDWDACTFTMMPIKDTSRPMLMIGGRHTGRLFFDVVREDGRHPSDILVEWLLDTNLQANFRTFERTMDDDAVAAAVRDPWTVSGASDAGAHIQMFCGAGDSAYLIEHLCRDAGKVTLEEAVHAVTQKQARFFGLGDRGVLRPGAAADLAVFALDELRQGDEVRVSDLPSGAWRYTREPGGFRATVVAGTPTWLDGKPTGDRPGTLLQCSPARGTRSSRPARPRTTVEAQRGCSPGPMARRNRSSLTSEATIRSRR